MTQERKPLAICEELVATEKRTIYTTTNRTAPPIKQEYDAPINPSGAKAKAIIEGLVEALRPFTVNQVVTNAHFRAAAEALEAAGVKP